MNIVYTNHAEEKIAERKISKTIIEKSLKSPDAVLDSVLGRKIAHKLIKDRLLKIIYTKKKNSYIVITAYYTQPERYEAEK
ncbi:MAG: DUF4258 domain-containing protein [Methanobacteriota archaeon]